MANALVYVIAFPFIAAFLAIKRVFVSSKDHHSYYDRLPEQHMLGGQSQGGQAVGGTSGASGGGETVASRTRSKKA